MASRTRTQGFTIIEAVLIVVVLAIVGLLGWRFWAMTHKTTTTASSTLSTSASAITSTADLKKTDSDLQNLSVDDGTLNSLNSQTSY